MAKMKQQRVKAAAEAKRHDAPSVDNRRARHEYHILESLEAGLVLTGTEVKSIRMGGVSIGEAYARFRDGEAWLLGMHVPPYKEGSFSNEEPNRPRKLLLKREQIVKLDGARRRKGSDDHSAADVFYARHGEGRTRLGQRQEAVG